LIEETGVPDIDATIQLKAIIIISDENIVLESQVNCL
jgi:uncharacterized membrane-anchored protein